jgi:hypothetical protein
MAYDERLAARVRALGRRMRGFITVHPDGLAGSQLDRWVHEAVSRARSLHPSRNSPRLPLDKPWLGRI